MTRSNLPTTRTYVVTGAAGRSGRRVARALLNAGHRVRAISRTREHLDDLVAAGADARVGNVADLEFVTKCFDGADVAYLLDPGDRAARDFRRSYSDIGHNFAAAASATSLKAAVFVSTIGAHDDRHRGFIMTHGDIELLLNAAHDVDVLCLRSPQFFENLFYFLPASRAAGYLATPIEPDAPLDMAANADVADYAVRRLLELDFEGHSAVEFYGPEVVTMRGIAKVIEAKLGRPFPAVRVPHHANVAAMVAAGMARDFSTLISDTWEVFSRSGILRAGVGQAHAVGRTHIATFLEQVYVPALLSGDMQ